MILVTLWAEIQSDQIQNLAGVSPRDLPNDLVIAGMKGMLVLRLPAEIFRTG
jgi:tRNA A22 N-methylase